MLKSQENLSERVLLGTNAAQLENIFIKRAVSQLFSCIFNAGLWKYYKEVCKSLIRFNFYKFAKEFINWNFFDSVTCMPCAPQASQSDSARCCFELTGLIIYHIFSTQEANITGGRNWACVRDWLKYISKENSTSWLARGNTW